LNKLPRLKYRTEIDGLRALAVIAVIINHFNKNIFPNGYLGVDIFFVISGYVITSSLSIRKSNNLRDFIFGFYKRRLKRLMPALIVFVIINSILISFFNPEPTDSIAIAKRSLLGISNITLYRGSWDYFSPSVDLNPFIHTWSLGVEEQFYFFFPIIVWFTGFGQQIHNSSNKLNFVLLFLTVLSITTFIYFSLVDKSAAYFLMPSRFWEIAFGSIIFLNLRNRTPFFNFVKNFSPTFISFLIIAILIIPLQSSFLSTILIVIFSGLLICSLKEETFVYKLFNNKNIRYLGLISYSLYLWHWGILSISRWTIGIHWWSIPFQILLIFSVADFSYRFIERPFRKKESEIEIKSNISKILISLVFSWLFLIIIQKPLKGKLFLGEEISQTGEKYKFKFSNISSDQCYLNQKYKFNVETIFSKCYFRKELNNKTYFFLGDSHTQSLWLGAEIIANENNANLFTFSSAGITFPVVETNLMKIDFNKKLKESKILIKAIENKVLSESSYGDIVFVTNRLPLYFEKGEFDKWLLNFERFTMILNKKNIKVVVSTPSPEFPAAINKSCRGQNPQWFNKTNQKECNIPIDFFKVKNKKYRLINEKLLALSKKYENLLVFNTLDPLCPEGQCKYFLEEKLLYTDEDHISNYSARYIIAPSIIHFINQSIVE